MQDSSTVRWKSPSNIALVKYWGKHGRQLPANPSVSLTLSQAYTDTQVKYDYHSNAIKEPKINFLFEYIGLRKQYEAKMNEMASLKSPDELINSVPDEKDREQLKSILGTSNLADIKTRELAQLQEQLALYEN